LKIIIVGSGAAGLFASLLLARAGHEVALLDRDRLEPAPDVESAAVAAFRAAAPQIVQPHAVAPRCRELLRQRLPDVYAALLTAGVAEAPLQAQLPPSLSSAPARPGDERLTKLLTRRSTIDWVLRRAAAAEPGVTLRYGMRAIGLTAAPGRPPHVTGVHTDHGEVSADLVIDAAGRRSPVDRWLKQIGAQPAATWRAECGVAYTSRHYRIRQDAEPPGLPTTIVAPLAEFTAGIWAGDNATMQVAVAPMTSDRRFRTIKDPGVFTAVLRTVPMLEPWLDTLEPISGIYQMAGLHNTLRRLVVGGTPVVTGLHAIGDAVCTTNPTLSRGLSLAITGAVDLAEAIGKHGQDWAAQALALDDLVTEHIAPFYEDQAAMDSYRLAKLRQTVFGAPAPPPPPTRPGRISFAELGMTAAADPDVHRAFLKVMGMICLPEEAYTDAHVVACAHRVLRQHRSEPQTPQPTREQLLTALTAAPPSAHPAARVRPSRFSPVTPVTERKASACRDPRSKSLR
jgi:2-polyprenyl-6-methoxyphenol hydroxylase-like FAD-dependent oxidoreductase